MGTLFKYIFYIILILLIYMVGKDIYDGKINEDTTVSQVGNTIFTDTEKNVENGIEKIREEITSVKIEPKTE